MFDEKAPVFNCRLLAVKWRRNVSPVGKPSTRCARIGLSWTKTQSQVTVADGGAYISHPQTGAWENGLQLATSYYPVIFAGCLMRMAEADTDSLVLLGAELLSGERVYHLAGPSGLSDTLELEYWLGVEDGLPLKAWCEPKSYPAGAMRRTRFASQRRCGCRTMERRWLVRAKPSCVSLTHILSRLPASWQVPQNRIQTAHIAEAIHLRSAQAAGVACGKTFAYAIWQDDMRQARQGWYLQNTARRAIICAVSR